MSTPATTRVVVIGAGAFGRNHIRIWQELRRGGLPVQLTGIVESDPATASLLATAHSVPVYPSIPELLKAAPAPDAASIAVPTSQHFQVASQLLAAGVDLLIEKPLTPTLEEADRLIALGRQHGRILQVGHLERFNPAVQAARAIVHRPLFFEIHRLSVFTPRSLDVDVVLDLMIHDLDLVLSFVQSPIRELHAVGLPILSPTVDIANVRLEFESGCVANFTASRVSTERVRKMRFFQPHQYISVDYARQDVLLIDVDGANSSAPKDKLPLQGMQPAHPTPQFAMQKLEVPSGEPLYLELESFLNAVRHRTQPAVSAQDGRNALALALDIRAAIAAHQGRAGLGSVST